MGRINKAITIPASKEGSFFRYWFEFLRPFHKLTSREMDVIASFVKHRFELSKLVNDHDLLDKLTMSEDVKKKVREDCNISQAHFQVIMTKLKKSKVIENGRINPRFIPNLEQDGNNFQLLISFELK